MAGNIWSGNVTWTPEEEKAIEEALLEIGKEGDRDPYRPAEELIPPPPAQPPAEPENDGNGKKKPRGKKP